MAALGAAAAAGEPASPFSFDDMLCHSQSTAFAVLSCTTHAVLYVSPNAATVLGIEAEALTGCVAASRCRAVEVTPAETHAWTHRHRAGASYRT